MEIQNHMKQSDVGKSLDPSRACIPSYLSSHTNTGHIALGQQEVQAIRNNVRRVIKMCIWCHPS
jgi:hypothetical protein